MGLLFAGITVLAQTSTTAPPPPPDTAGILFARKPPPAEPRQTQKTAGDARPISAGVAAELALSMPSYKAETVDSNLDKSLAASPEVDRPKNQIPRLPVLAMQKYVVRESRLPVFRKLDLYSSAGLIDLSFKEHPGLRIGNFFNLNANVAKEMIVDELLLEEKRDLADLSRAMAFGDEIERSEAQQKADGSTAPVSSPPK